MRSRYWLLLLALVPATALAWGDGCKLRADRAGGVDAKGVEKVVMRTGAGDMKVVGRGNAVRIEARGVACAAKQELLDATQISVRREGNVVYVETDAAAESRKAGLAATTNTPTSTSASRCRRASRWTPPTRAATLTFEDLKALTLQDSSGDLDLTASPASPTSATVPATSRSRTRAACACATARATSKSTKYTATSKWCSTARATSTSRKSTATSGCSRTARAASASKTSKATSTWIPTARAISMPGASEATSR